MFNYYFAAMDYVPPNPSEDENVIFASMEKGINFSRYSNIKVKMSGRCVPKTIERYIILLLFKLYNKKNKVM